MWEYNTNYLCHYGSKGMKWGQRRWQNEDGSLTPAGRVHYGYGQKMNDKDSNDSSVTRKVKKDYNNLSDEEFRSKYQVSKDIYRKRVNKYGDPYMNSPLAKAGKRLEEINKAKEKERQDKINKAKEYSKAKEEKRQDKINKAKEYSKANTSAVLAEEKAEKAWRDVRSQYKSLAKTPIGRFKEVSKAQKGNGSDAAKKYLSDWDRAEKLSDESYAKTQEMKKKYEALGRNRISRIITAAKYS